MQRNGSLLLGLDLYEDYAALARGLAHQHYLVYELLPFLISALEVFQTFLHVNLRRVAELFGNVGESCGS